MIAVDANNVISNARIAAGGIAAVPIRLTGIEAMLKGRRADADLIESAAAAAAALPAAGDDANPSEYRQELAGHLTQRALTKAIEQVRA